jgi:hypothetical protein
VNYPGQEPARTRSYIHAIIKHALYGEHRVLLGTHRAQQKGVSHDLCLSSRYEEFPLVGNPDAEDLGLGRSTVYSGNPGVVVEWYEQYCRRLARSTDSWGMLQDSDGPTPAWADPDPVARHIAMIDAFLAFAPGAKFGAS